MKALFFGFGGEVAVSDDTGGCRHRTLPRRRGSVPPVCGPCQAAGVNAQFDERWTGDNLDLIRSAATNLVELNPDVILAQGARVLPILMELTRSIPIVTTGGSEPVARGLGESLARPGGNVTGFATTEVSVIGKMLQTLKEIALGDGDMVSSLHCMNDPQPEVTWQATSNDGNS